MQPLSVTPDPYTNHLNTIYSYDLNGNPTPYNSGGYAYDVANRLIAVGVNTTPEFYAYDASNKRVMRQKTDGSQEFYFYGVNGKKLGTYVVSSFYSGYPGTLQLTASSTNLYFAGKLIQSINGAVVADRLGSVRQVPGAYPALPERYYPYGDEYGAGTANDQVKFATYTRDGSTGLDYAD